MLSATEAHLRRAPYLHTYELGDLDPLQLPHCTWYARPGASPAEAAAVALVYRGLATPTLIALAHDDPAALRALLAEQLDALPARFYAHCTPGIEAALAPRFRCELLGHHLKMALAPTALADDPEVVALGPADADAALAFYAEAYPASYFEPSNLARGPYVAIRDARGLAAVAGTHVYSPALRVASLGNIATRPDARGRGLARRVTAGLCRRLQPAIEVIGLNVRADNAAAIACYRRVGFEVRHVYDEWRASSAASPS